MEKTAVDYLIKEFSEILGPIDTKPMQDLLMMDAMKRAKKMFEKQIIDAYCHNNIDDVIMREFAEQYYNKTFKHGLNNLKRNDQNRRNMY